MRCALIFLLSIGGLFLNYGVATASSYQVRSDLGKALYKAAREQGINPAYIFAIAHQESTVWPYTLNVANKGLWYKDYASAKTSLLRAVKTKDVAIGAMQIYWPVWKATLKYSAYQLLNPYVNARVGTAIFKSCLKQSKGDPHKALALYNAGKNWHKKEPQLYADNVIKMARRYMRVKNWR